MPSFVWFTLSAVAEISGCYTFWSWLRLGRNPLWVLPGLVSLILFAFFLTRVAVSADAAGRAYAAYGGIYITASLAWLWVVEGMRPDRWDLMDALVCLAGTGIILFSPHHA